MGGVGILIFIDQHVAKAVVILGEDFGVFLEQANAFEQEIAEIGGVQCFEPGLIVLVDLLALAIGKEPGIGRGDVLGQQAAIFPAIHHGRELAGRPAFLVDVFGGEQLLDQTDLVVGVQNREIGAQADQFGVATDQPRADGVEGAKPWHALDRGSDQLADALLHLAGGLVGEGDGEDLVATGFSRGKDMGDAGGQDAGLSRAGAGEDQQGAFGCLYRLALFGVEPGKISGLTRGELGGDGALGAMGRGG